MVRTSLVLAALLLVVIHLCSRISGQPVVLGDSFNFSTTSQPQCPPGAELRLLHILLNGTEVLVASRDDAGFWKASPSYAERLELSDSVVLTNINYNDDGSYVSSCSDDKKTLKLEVVDSLKEYLVAVNGTVHFPCHAVTVSGDVKSAWWKIDGRRVVKMNLSSQKIITEATYTRRVSVPTDCFSNGNFTPTLGPVRFRDQGDWTCSIEYRNGTTRTFVARLTVQETRNETSTAQPGSPHVNKGMDHTARLAIAIVVILVLCALFGIRWWMRSRMSSPPPPPRPQPEGAQDHVAVPLFTQNEPGAQANGLALNGHRRSVF